MPTSDHDAVRPRAGDGSAIGVERYTLLKAAFAHVQQSIRHDDHLEAITVLESILTDRLGSMVHGMLGHKVTLRHTLGRLVKLAAQAQRIDEGKSAERSAAHHYAPMPPDIMDFLTGRLSRWWKMRNTAVHAMAKLRHVGDATFAERYKELSEAALEGIRVVQQLDIYDQREKTKNGAGRSATWPDALRLDSDIEQRVNDVR